MEFKYFQRIKKKLLRKALAQYVAHVINSYLDRICQDVHIDRPLKVVIDCGNGVACCCWSTLSRIGMRS